MSKLVPVLLAAALTASGQLLSTAWVELGEGGRTITRVVVNTTADCPSVEADGTRLTMTPRSPVPQGFRPVCEAVVPAGTRAARVMGQTLALPHGEPSKIAVIGDTGCRIKGAEVQDCKSQWPFERVATAAASTQPQLVIHVGDYLYREDACPQDKQALCGGSPHGDNWDAWNADFFQPAAKLLAAAPWALSRGNHEACDRSWRGWFYYLDSRPWQDGACQPMPPPVSIQLGTFQLIEFDSSAIKNGDPDPEQVRNYAAQLSSLHAKNAWLVDHHPFWALRQGQDGAHPIAETEALQRAWDQASPQGIGMVLSGHTHVFELLGYGPKRPLQIVAGDAGTTLERGIPHQLNGADIYGMMVEQSEEEEEFGYTLLTKSSTGWTLSLRNPQTKELLNCAIQDRKARCK
jgi:Calcineurin-like phosphoesterase